MNLDKEEMRRGETGGSVKRARTRGGNERRGERATECDDQVLVGLVRDARICSRSPMIFTQAPSPCQEEGGV